MIPLAKTAANVAPPSLAVVVVPPERIPHHKQVDVKKCNTSSLIRDFLSLRDVRRLFVCARWYVLPVL